MKIFCRISNISLRVNDMRVISLSRCLRVMSRCLRVISLRVNRIMATSTSNKCVARENLEQRPATSYALKSVQ